MTFRILRSI